MKAKVIPIMSADAVCGGCHWWRPFDAEAGECFYNPPVARVLKDGSVDMCRPITVADEPSCAMLKGRH